MILSGKTVRVKFIDGRITEPLNITNRDELRFEQREKIALPRVLDAGGGVPFWVVAGIIHWRLLRSDTPDIPADFDEFADLLDPYDFLDVVDEGKAEASDPTPSTG